MRAHVAYRWHRSRPVAWRHRRWGRGFYLGQGPGGAQHLSRAEAAELWRRLKTGDVARRTVQRRTEEA